mmetsp:Transcript_17685/g.45275  ORF Transcript_17685/g.45275 Transcript_17685/m.45275 type:complete len:261 (-) Transcript_17685:241-1023(-)
MPVQDEVGIDAVGEHAALRLPADGREVTLQRPAHHLDILLRHRLPKLLRPDDLAQVPKAPQLHASRRAELGEAVVRRLRVVQDEDGEGRWAEVRRGPVREPSHHLALRHRHLLQLRHLLRNPGPGAQHQLARLKRAPVGTGDRHPAGRQHAPGRQPHPLQQPRPVLPRHRCVRADAVLGREDSAVWLVECREVLWQAVAREARIDLRAGEDLVREAVQLRRGCAAAHEVQRTCWIADFQATCDCQQLGPHLRLEHLPQTV